MFMEFIKNNFKSIFNIFLFAIISILPFILIIHFYIAPQIKEMTVQTKKDEPKLAVESVFNILEHFHHQVESQQMTLEEAQNSAKAVIKTLRFSGQEYFWIHDKNLKMVMHPFKPDLDGKDLSEFKDPQGKFLFKEMNRVSIQSGQNLGYVDYMWPKPGKTDPQPKASFVKYFDKWEWVVGSGVYIDDIIEKVDANLNQIYLYFTIATVFSLLVLISNVIRQIIKTTLPIKRSVSKLQTESKNLEHTAEDLSKVAQSITNSSVLQSESLISTTSALTQINTMLEKTQSRAETNQDIINQVKDSASNGFNVVTSLSELLSEINEQSKASLNDIEETLKEMDSIGSVIAKIADKTKMIDEIVFQTRLLSFNASVEAARAGEAGKGFSIVADEIGALAHQSGDSASEINQIIEQSQKQVELTSSLIQKKTHELVGVLSRRVEESLEYSEKCYQILDSVVSKATQAEHDSRAILEATGEVKIGSQEITNSVYKLESASKDNAKAAEKTSSGVESLLNQSHQLSALLEDLKDSA
jgi:methyl-accepting chemotaxis protein